MDELDVPDWKDFIGTSASIWTILQMLAPVPTCYHFIQKQTVGDMIVTPYVVAFTSCSLWLLYGIIIDDNAIFRVNIIGTGLQFSYILCYYIYCIKKAEVRQQFAIGLCAIISAVLYIYYETDIEKLYSSFGLLCSCVTVLFFLSPLANMRYIVKIWNSESLPRLLIASTFIVAIQWLLYGYIVNDTYVMVTNFLGTVLAGSQLALALIIPSVPTQRYSPIV